ncbi:permease [Clostridia bacterium]|nr:permease [Clostridia bacterium]
MSIISNIVASLVSMFLILAVGFALRKTNKTDGELTRGLSTVLVTAGLPAMILSALQQTYSHERLVQLGVMTAGFFVTVMLGVGVGVLICLVMRVPLREAGLWVNCLAFSNAIFMVRPIIVSIYGEDALFPLTGIIFCFNVLTFSLGAGLMSLGAQTGENRTSVKDNIVKFLLNPSMIATFVGLLLFRFSIALPAGIATGLSMISNVTTPIAMLVIGMLLAETRFADIIADKRVYIISVLKLAIIPILTDLILSPFVHDPLLLHILILGAVMPTASTVAVFAKQHENNPHLASCVVFFSTCLSVISIPIIASIILE